MTAATDPYTEQARRDTLGALDRVEAAAARGDGPGAYIAATDGCRHIGGSSEAVLLAVLDVVTVCLPWRDRSGGSMSATTLHVLDGRLFYARHLVAVA